MIDFDNYDKAVIVTSDDDFCCLVRYFYNKGKLLKVLSPNRKNCSILLTRAAKEKIDFMDSIKIRLEYLK